MNSKSILTGLFAFLLLLSSARAELIHRFSFSDAKAKDSAGKLEATLKGPGASIADGQLVLKNSDYATGGEVSCLEFASSVLPKEGTSVSLVVWFTAKDIGEYARVINVGASEGSEGIKFIYFAPRTADGTARIAITGSDVSSKTYIDVSALDDGKQHMVAIVIDGTAKKLHTFVDGTEPGKAEDLGANTLDKVTPLQNWLGKSSFSADPGLRGSINEFRVYDEALSAEKVAALAKAGPDEVPPPAESTPAASPKK